MQNKTGIIIGFVSGVAGFLLMFKVLFLDHIPPDDELAPGIEVLISVLNGFLFGYIGSRIQNSLAGNNKSFRIFARTLFQYLVIGT